MSRQIATESAVSRRTAIHGWFCAALLLALTSQRLSAQQIVGRVMTARNPSPVAWSVVQLLGDNGRIVATATTSTSGGFILKGFPAGVYRLRAIAIGYSPKLLSSFTVGTGTVRVPDFDLTAALVTLPEINVSAGTVCGVSVQTAPLFGQVLEAAQLSLEVIEATAMSGEFSFDISRTREVSPRGRTRGPGVKAAVTDSVWSANSWPVAATSPDRLRERGWASSGMIEVPGEKLKRTYYGPDAGVLFAPWFIESHCFSLRLPRGERDTTIAVGFEPKDSPRIEIAGSMLLDRRTMALLSIEWEYRHLPEWIKPDDTGGKMLVSRLANGVWYPSYWMLWAPIESIGLGRLTGPLIGRTEERSTVTKVTRVRGDTTSGEMRKAASIRR